MICSPHQRAFLFANIQSQFIQSLLDHELLERHSIGGKTSIHHIRALRRGARDEDSADGFLRCTTIGAGDAGGGKGVIRSVLGARTFRHLARNGFAHGAVFGESSWKHAEGVLLGGVAIRAMAGEENGGCAGHIGKAMSQ